MINSSVDTSSVRSSVVKFVLGSPGKKDKQNIGEKKSMKRRKQLPLAIYIS